MPIDSITGAVRARSMVTDNASVTTASASTRPQTEATGSKPVETTGSTLTPPRFPWLSRLSQQLESVSRQKPAFTAAPIIGDNVDQKA